MKKLIVLVFILMFSAPFICLANDQAPKPRVEIKTPRGVKLGTPVRVYMFYDTTAMILCYVTARGESMQCWQHSEMSVDMQRKINELLLNFKAQHNTIPSIIVIPNK
mgnify:CR=1 FL=1